MIFSAVADAIEWLVKKNGITYCMHYLDDFLTMGPANSPVCQQNLDLLRQTCDLLGFPLKLEKVEGPTKNMVFLSIEVDTVRGTLSLPETKLQQYRAELTTWSTHRAARRRKYLSLVGKLSHACRVIRPSRIFLRRMIQRAGSVTRLDHWVRLGTEFRTDLGWWLSFLELLNGKTRFRTQARPDRGIQITSDALGNWGCGAAWGRQELLPIVLACAMWGRQWRHQNVLVRCNNMVVVAVWAAQQPLIMHLLRCLHFAYAYFELDLHIEHIKGCDNVIADAISRNNLQVLQKEAPGLDPVPLRIPQVLLQLLVKSRPDWLSARWNQWWKAFLQEV